MRVQVRARRVVVAVALVASAAVGTTAGAGAEPGDLDPGFGDGGVVTTDLGGEEAAEAVAVQPDGKVVVAGAVRGLVGSLAELVVTRYAPGGDRDPGFGDGGVVRGLVHPVHAEPRAVLVQPDGGIVVAGYAEYDVGAFVLRLTPAGHLDPSFGAGGIAAIPADDATYWPGTVALARADDGDLLVAYPTDQSWGVARLSPAGAVDPSFQLGGPLAGAPFEIGDLLVQPDGRMLVTGTLRVPSRHLVVHRLLADGAPDPTWLGSAAGAAPALEGRAAVALQPDGRVLVASTEADPRDGRGGRIAPYAFAVTRLTAAGRPDPSFDGDGTAHVGDTWSGSEATDVVVEPGGTILVVGRTDHATRVARLTGTGRPDRRFGTAGVVDVVLGLNPRPRGAALVDGRLVVAGGTEWTQGDLALLAFELGHLPVRSGYWMVDAVGGVHAFGDAGHHGGPELDDGVEVVDIEVAADGDGYWVLDSDGLVHAFGSAEWFGDDVPHEDEYATSISALPNGEGYWIFTDRGRATPRGAAWSHGDARSLRLNGPILDSVGTPSGNGYYLVGADGGIFGYGDADFHGSMGGQPLNEPVRSLVPDPDGTGYWLVAGDGGAFAFEAGFRGSMGGQPLNRPVVGMVAYGDGYLMVGEDGGIFSFSDRPFAGSLGADPPEAPIVGVAALDDGA